jgi:hypothetical protein
MHKDTTNKHTQKNNWPKYALAILKILLENKYL